MMTHIYREKIVLCLSIQQTLAGVWQGQKLKQHLQFTQDEIGIKAFAAFLQQHAQAHCYLILDVPEENYQQQSLPHSTGRTQKTLLARKLAQVYRDVLFCAATHVGRATNPPKKDLFLFAAVADIDALQERLVLLQSTACHIAGAYLLSTLTENLLHSGLIDHEQSTEHLLLCERLNSGLRQTYLVKGRLSMSRLLTHMPAMRDWDNFYQEETQKYKRYLLSQHLLETEATLHVKLLHPEMDAHYLSQQARKLKLPIAALQSMPELAHMQRLIHGVKPADLAPPSLTLKYRQQCTKHQFALWSLTALLLSVCLSSYLFYVAQQLASQSSQLTTQIAHQQLTLNQAQQQSHVLTKQASMIQETVNAADQIAALPSSPLRMMQVLSTAFAMMPDDAAAMKMNMLQWSFKTKESHFNGDESALLDVETKSLAQLQAYTTHLRNDTNVVGVEMISSPESSQLQAIQGSTAPDEITSHNLQSYQLVVTLKPQNDRWH